VQRFLLVVIVAAVGAMPPAEAAARKAGRVVRVERTGGSRVLQPYLCQVTPHAGGSMCYGHAPRVGDVGVAAEGDLMVVQVRVLGFTSNPDCPSSSWLLEFDEVEGSLNGNTFWALFDGGIDPRRSRSVPLHLVELPPDRADANVQVAFDRDGNGTAGLLSLIISCDGGSGRGVYGASCFEYWVTDRGGPWVRLREDVYAC